MLSLPNGWEAQITLGDCTRTVSCKKFDIPYELLEALTQLYRTGRPQVVGFWNDQESYLFVFEAGSVHVVTKSDLFPVLYQGITIDLNDLAMEVLKDVMSGMNEWAAVLDKNKINHTLAGRLPGSKVLFHACDRLHAQMEAAGAFSKEGSL